MEEGVVVDMIAWLLNLQLPIQSVRSINIIWRRYTANLTNKGGTEASFCCIELIVFKVMLPSKHRQN